MKRLLLCCFTVLSFLTNGFGQCAETSEPKVLLVGDSWAFFMGVDQTINNVFKKWGHSDCTFYTNLTLAENGAETNDFLTSTKQDEILAKLIEYPSIKFIHLSIGGNDALGDWNINFTQPETDTLIEHISQGLLDVITFIRTARPDIKIFWSGYVYPNFGEVIESAAPFQSSHPFYGTWEGMGFPTFDRINGLLDVFSYRAQQYADTTDNVDYVPCTGMMQYTFGQNTPLGVPPGGTYAPFTQPLPYGDVNYPSPKDAMRDYGITKDCFHLSPQGYRDFIDYHTRKFYHKALMHDFYAVASGPGQTGSISSAGAVSDTLYMGEQDGVNFAPLFTFDLTGMADTTVAKASLFIRRESLAGTNPISSSLNVKLKVGYFGSSATVESADLVDAATIEGTPCLFGSNDGDADWIRLDLPSSFMPYIQNNKVQFIVEAPNATGGAVRLSNATDEPDFAPILDIVYGSNPLGIANINADNKLDVYPNPTTGLINFKADGFNYTTAEVFNLPGQLMLKTTLTGPVLDITTLPEGIYVLKLTGPKGIVNRKIVKN
jgi:hypothetical protein